MHAWQWKSAFYERARNLPGLQWILIAERRQTAMLLAQIPGTVRSVVDAGCGTGSTMDLLPAGDLLLAADMSMAMVRRVPDAPARARCVADAAALPVRPGSADLVACIGVTEYIPDWQALLRECGRVLTPDGYLLITFARTAGVNLLRFVLGHRVRMASMGLVKHLLADNGFELIEKGRTIMQMQLLCRKIR